MSSKTLTSICPAAIENRRLVWTFSFEAAGSKGLVFYLNRKRNKISVGWRRIAMFPVTSRTGHEGLFISVVGKNTTWFNVSY